MTNFITSSQILLDFDRDLSLNARGRSHCSLESPYHPMKSMLKTTFLSQAFCVAALALGCGVSHAQIAAQWTFEGSFGMIPGTSTSISGLVAEGGTFFGASTGSVVHASASTWSSPVGNGSSHSLSANTWAVGDYFQFQTRTLGLNNIMVSYDQVSSSTGPGRFTFAYSTDGTTFTPFATDYTVLVNAAPNTWTSGTPVTTTTYTYDLSSVPALNNASFVWFRLIDSSTTSAGGATVATAGTDRVDNFTVQVVPEPTTTAIAGIGLFALVLGRRFHR